jgi:DHA1 family bicyclomycin/chloramphenicol resistance-like MFS transporter
MNDHTARPSSAADRPHERDTATASAPKVPTAMFVAMFAMGPAAFQIFLPALPALSEQFSPRPEVLALTVSLATAAFACATLLYGGLIDRFGRRNFFLAGCAMLCLGSLICATATSIEVIVLGRMLQSIGGAAGVVVSRTVAMDIHRGPDVMRVFSRLAAASVIVPMGATFVGGFLADALGWRYNFLAILALASIVLALSIKLLPETRPTDRPAAPRNLLAGYGKLVRSRFYLCHALLNAFALSANAVFMVAMPLLFAKYYGFTPVGIGLVFAAVGFSFFVGTWASTRLPVATNPRRWVVVATALIAAISLASWALIHAGYDAMPWMLVAIVAINAGNGLISASIQAGAIRAVPGAEGSASGLLVFMGSLAMAGLMQVWPLVGGKSATAFASTMALIAACCVASMLCAQLIPKGSRPP